MPVYFLLRNDFTNALDLDPALPRNSDPGSMLNLNLSGTELLLIVNWCKYNDHVSEVGSERSGGLAALSAARGPRQFRLLRVLRSMHYVTATAAYDFFTSFRFAASGGASARGPSTCVIAGIYPARWRGSLLTLCRYEDYYATLRGDRSFNAKLGIIGARSARRPRGARGPHRRPIAAARPFVSPPAICLAMQNDNAYPFAYFPPLSRFIVAFVVKYPALFSPVRVHRQRSRIENVTSQFAGYLNLQYELSVTRLEPQRAPFTYHSIFRRDKKMRGEVK
ncbi:hypothetical protein EVAR_53270_1 [Eumeta japonica]|uniref:Uncharacterized protein n=1 Tax=Eumeta variegata TaxID=151549 RepID=A0A4C1YHA9_EUMVA|nr:hypothetical protein EVAR_53270_1 [Eumeta japonica]